MQRHPWGAAKRHYCFSLRPFAKYLRPVPGTDAKKAPSFEVSRLAMAGDGKGKSDRDYWSGLAARREARPSRKFPATEPLKSYPEDESHPGSATFLADAVPCGDPRPRFHSCGRFKHRTRPCTAPVHL